MKLNLKTWLIELRAPFFTATFVPVIAGSLLAWAYFGIFKWFHFLLTIFGATMIHAGLNMINDYFDYISGNDVINKEKNPPFSGGSPFLPSGILKPKSVYFAAISCFLIGAIIGLFLAFDMGLENGWVIILIGI
ncbi:MAG: prenyltransferase, partial [Candidatus Thermoplasmatota archaeon]